MYTKYPRYRRSEAARKGIANRKHQARVTHTVRIIRVIWAVIVGLCLFTGYAYASNVDAHTLCVVEICQ